MKGTRIALSISFLAIAVSAEFVASPESIVPLATESLELRCVPEVKDAVSVLAILIRKSTEPMPEEGTSGDEYENEYGSGTKDELGTRSGRAQGNPYASYSGQTGETDEGSADTRGLNPYGYKGRNGETTTGKRRRRRQAAEDDELVYATIGAGNKITIIPQNQRFYAQGDVSDNIHLSLTILNPGLEDIGQYECQVTQFSATGQMEVNTQKAMVTQSVSLGGAGTSEERLELLEAQMKTCIVANKGFKSWQKEFQDTTRMLQQQVSALELENKQLVDAMADITSNINGLREQVEIIDTNQNGKLMAHLPVPVQVREHHANYPDHDNSVGNQDNGDYSDNLHGNGGEYINDGVPSGDSPFNPRAPMTTKAFPRSHVGGQEKLTMDAKMEQLANTRQHVLEQLVDELRSDEEGLEEKLSSMEWTINTTLEVRLQHLEGQHWQELSNGVNQLLTMVLPMLTKEMNELQNRINEIHGPNTTHGVVQTAAKPHTDGQSQGLSKPWSANNSTIPEVMPGLPDFQINSTQDAADVITDQSQISTEEPVGDVSSLGGADEGSVTPAHASPTAEDAKYDDVISTQEPSDVVTAEQDEEEVNLSKQESDDDGQRGAGQTTPAGARGGGGEREDKKERRMKPKSKSREDHAPAPAMNKLGTGPKCCVCGNRTTHEACTADNIDNVAGCPKNKPACMTEIYQNGSQRFVYKRCASVADCQKSPKMSSPGCRTTSFMTADPMECHFCCTTSRCNKDLRPHKNLYTG